MSTPTTQRPVPAPAAPLPDPTTPHHRPRALRRWLPTLIQLGLLTIIVLCPMFFIVMGAFTDKAERTSLFDFGNFTLDNFAVFGSDTARGALLSSTAVGVGSSLVALGIGCTL